MIFGWNKPPLPDRLNLCFVAQKMPVMGYGSEQGFLWAMARKFVSRGHKVTYLSWRGPQRRAVIDSDGISIFYLGEGTHAPLADFPEMVLNKCRSLHQVQPFHIVHGIDYSVKKLAREKKELGVAVAVDVRATSMSKIFNIMALSQDNLLSVVKTDLRVAYTFLHDFYMYDRWLLKRADGVFVSSAQQQIVLERYFGFPQWRTYRVPYGIDIGDISPRLKSDELMKKLGLPPNSQVVCCVSDMTQEEDLRVLLSAFERVAVKKPSARMIIVGDGPKRSSIEYTMLNLALGSRVVFTGEVDSTETADYVALSDVFVNLSSQSTGFESDLLLAMALEKMIIGSEISPISTIVTDGADGFLIRPADAMSLTRLILEAFENPSSAQAVGHRARQKVLELFDMEKMVQETLAAYSRILLSTGRYKDKPNAAVANA